MRPRRGREFGARPTARDCCVSSSLLYPPLPSPPSPAHCGHGPPEADSVHGPAAGGIRAHDRVTLSTRSLTSSRCRPVASLRTPSTDPIHTTHHAGPKPRAPSRCLADTLADTSSRPRSPSTRPRPLPAHNPSSIPTRPSTPSSSWAPCASTASARLCRSSTASTNMSSPR